MRKLLLTGLLPILLLAGCDKRTLLHTYQPLDDSEWNRIDTVTFSLPVLTADDACSMVVGLRVTNRYPYELLVMEVEQQFQHPFAHRMDTIYYRLADEDGILTEKGIYYFQYESEALPLELKKGQTGEVKIRHLMHREILPGIMDVGIHIVR